MSGGGVWGAPRTHLSSGSEGRAEGTKRCVYHSPESAGGLRRCRLHWEDLGKNSGVEGKADKVLKSGLGMK